MKALKIKFDLKSGKRPGNINPRDKNLQCNGWQDLENEVEIRLIEDDRDVEQYRNVEGITILDGKEEINNEISKIEANKNEEVVILDKDLVMEHLKAEGKFNLLKGASLNDKKEELYKEGIAGIGKKDIKLTRI
jgi:hypothetical protein